MIASHYIYYFFLQQVQMYEQNPLSFTECLDQQFRHQMTVWFEQVREEKQKRVQVPNEGLPNMGYTCFLNSTLQLLYSAQKFREYVISFKDKGIEQGNREGNGNKAILLGLLAKIFEDIKLKNPKRQKEQDLYYLIKKVQEMKGDYERSTMQDAFEFLLFILDQLQSFDQKLIEYFQFRYETQCKCPAIRNMFEDVSISYKPLRCANCKHELKVKIVQPSQYLICISSKSNQRSEEMQYNNGKLKYELLSSIIYDGNGQEGHYMAERKINRLFYYFDDNHIRYKMRFGKFLILLYQRKQQKKEEIPPMEIKQMKIEKEMPCGHRMNEKMLIRKLPNLIKMNNFAWKCTSYGCNAQWDWWHLKKIVNFNQKDIFEFQRGLNQQSKSNQILKYYQQISIRHEKQKNLKVFNKINNLYQRKQKYLALNQIKHYSIYLYLFNQQIISLLKILAKKTSSILKKLTLHNKMVSFNCIREHKKPNKYQKAQIQQSKNIFSKDLSNSLVQIIYNPFILALSDQIKKKEQTCNPVRVPFKLSQSKYQFFVVIQGNILMRNSQVTFQQKYIFGQTSIPLKEGVYYLEVKFRSKQRYYSIGLGFKKDKYENIFKMFYWRNMGIYYAQPRHYYVKKSNTSQDDIGKILRITVNRFQNSVQFTLDKNVIFKDIMPEIFASKELFPIFAAKQSGIYLQLINREQ